MRPAAWTAIVALALGAFPAGAADEEGSFVVRGAGRASCERYTTEREEKSGVYLVFLGWLDGYLTAVNQTAQDTYDIAAWESTELLAAFIDSHCRQNPDHNFYRVTHAVASWLMADRLRQKSPRVEASAGDKQVEIYQESLKRAQQALKDGGYYRGGIDGVFGPKTSEALSAFQQDRGLDETGLPDQLTLLHLLRPEARTGGE